MIRDDDRERRAVAWFLAVFFTSGFSALALQILWQRLLTLFVGADIHSVTLVVAAFMGGLGLGSLAGGHLADRLGRGQLAAFAASQLAVALFAFVSVPLYYDLLYLRLGHMAESRFTTAALLFTTLLWPTFFMGASLPLLSKALTRSTERAAERIGALYGLNTMGGAAGALAAAWVFARSFGFRGAVAIAAALNLACAAVSLLLARHGGRRDAGPAAPPEGDDPVPAPVVLSFPAWALVYALSGFIALSLEIVWFRLLRVLLRSDAFTFPMLLALYLTGLGLGALVAGPVARRSRRPAQVFLALQAGVTVFAGLSVTILTWSMAWRYAGAAPASTGAGGALEPPVSPISLGGGLAGLLLILPPTLMMGASFSFLQRVAQTDLGRLGRRVGWLQSANIAGALAGAVLTGVVLLHGLGSSGTLRLLVALGGAFLLLWYRARFGARGRLGEAGAVALTGLLVWLCPGPSALWAALHRTTSARILFAEDGSGLAALKEGRRGGAGVHVNGREQASLPYGGPNTLMGALPAMLHPRPRSVLVIGLASGDTLFSSGGRPETETLDCVEIVAPQRELLLRFAAWREDPGLRSLLADTRARFLFADGRAFLLRTDRRWDLIQAYAQLPDEACAGNLYSLEYFRLVGRRLRPGGFAVSWDSTPRMRDTFVRAFPHVLAVGRVLIGSHEPIAFEPQAVRGRLREPAVRDYYRRAGVDIDGIVSPALQETPVQYGPFHDRSTLLDINTDLFPKDEYRVGRR